jgi:hypothetical protein
MRVSKKYGTNKTVRKNYSHDYNHKKSGDEKSVWKICFDCLRKVDEKKIPYSKPGFSVDNHFVIDGYRRKIGKIKYCEKCAGRFCCPEPNIYISEKWNKKEHFNIKFLNEYIDDIDIIEEYNS